MRKSKIRNISFFLLFLFVILYASFVIFTHIIDPLLSVLFVMLFAVWGIATDLLTKSDNTKKKD